MPYGCVYWTIALLYNSVRDIVRGNGGKPRHQQLLHGPAEHRKSAAPPRNHARVHRRNSRALSSKPAPRRPRTRQQRPATPDKSPPEDTTRGVKGWGQGRVRHKILTGRRHQKTNPRVPIANQSKRIEDRVQVPIDWRASESRERGIGTTRS